MTRTNREMVQIFLLIRLPFFLRFDLIFSFTKFEAEVIGFSKFCCDLWRPLRFLFRCCRTRECCQGSTSFISSIDYPSSLLNREPVSVTTAIQEEIFREMGIDPSFGIACLQKVSATYESDMDLMIQFYRFVAKEDMACDEAELDTDFQGRGGNGTVVLLVVVAVGFILFLEFHGDHEDWSIPPT